MIGGIALICALAESTTSVENGLQLDVSHSVTEVRVANTPEDNYKLQGQDDDGESWILHEFF